MSDKKPKVIKKVDRAKLDDYKRQHEIALLKLLAPEYPDLIKQIAESLNPNKNSCILTENKV